MTHEQQHIDLARRLVACTHFRWLPGMRTYGARVLAAPEYPYTVGTLLLVAWPVDDSEPEAAIGHALISMSLPDLSDPLTCLAVLLLVRDAWGDPLAAAIATLPTRWVVRVAVSDSSPLLDYRRDTEAEALVAALEAAPPR